MSLPLGLCSIAVCCLLARCVGGEPAAPAGTPVATSTGGQVGNACATENQLGCSPDSKTRVLCTAAKWVAEASCTSPETCKETATDGSVTATVCQLTPTSRVERAIACAKADHCLHMPMGECMDPLLVADFKALVQGVGGVEADALLPLQVDAKIACIRSATSCAAVNACVQAAHACGTTSSQTCSGTKAQICSTGLALAVDCAAIGQPCTMLSSGSKAEPFCANAPPCTVPNSVSCSGSVAKVCVPMTAAKNVELQYDCARLGASCNPAAKSAKVEAFCTYPAAPACQIVTFAESCSGTTALTCSSGKVVSIDCAKSGKVCAMQSYACAPASANCVRFPQCPVDTEFVPVCLPPGSNTPKTLVFCDGVAGMRSFDCALAGMEFDGYECAFAKVP